MLVFDVRCMANHMYYMFIFTFISFFFFPTIFVMIILPYYLKMKPIDFRNLIWNLMMHFIRSIHQIRKKQNDLVVPIHCMCISIGNYSIVNQFNTFKYYKKISNSIDLNLNFINNNFSILLFFIYQVLIAKYR